MAQSITIMDQLTKRYADQHYRYPVILNHKGTVIAFAMNQDRKIYYCVLDVASQDSHKYMDVESWPADPAQLQFPNEITEVGYSIAGYTPLPLIKNGSRNEAEGEVLRVDEVDHFLSTTARFTADAPFQVFSNNKHIFVFRQSISADHSDTIYKLKNGGSTSNPDLPGEEYIYDQNEAKVTLVSSTLLCDQFVLAGTKLLPTREARFQRSRHKTKPASRSDALGLKDMNGNPFFAPTQELSFVSNMHQGCFDIIQLPTAVSSIKRWQIFSHNYATNRLDMFNVEVSGEGLFNLAGTQLYTSPDARYQRSVLERQPGTCPFTERPLEPVGKKSNHSETCFSCSGNGDYARADINPWNTSSFTVEVWVKANSENASNESGIFASKHGSIEHALQITHQDSKYYAVIGTTKIVIAPVRAEWMHLAVTYNGKELQVFCDGNITGSTTKELESVTFVNYLLGCEYKCKRSFNGDIDEIRVWSNFRSELNIKSSKSLRLIGDEPGLQAYWRFNEGSGSVVYDQTNNACHASIFGKPSWKASSCPIASNSSMSRSSITFSDRKMIGGLSAKLYFQQEEVFTGYEKSSRPMKKQARILLAASTKPSTTDGDAAIAALDFAVSSEGQISEIPEEIVLPSLEKPKDVANSSKLTVLEETARAVNAEIVQLSRHAHNSQLEVNRLPELRAEVSTWENNLKAAKHAVLAAEKDITHSWHNIYFNVYRRKAYIRGADFHHSRTSATKVRFEAVEDGSGYYRIRREGGTFLHMDSRDYIVEWHNPNLHNSHWKPVRRHDGSYLIKSRYKSTYIHPAADGRVVVWHNPNNGKSRINLERQGFCDNAVRSLQDEVTKIEVTLEEIRKDLENVLKVQSEMQNTLRSIEMKKIEQKGLQEEIGWLSDGTIAPLEVGMQHIHTDVSGLSVSGGILEFAQCEQVPHILVSATGCICLYYIDLKGKMSAAYYDTNVERSRYFINQYDSLSFQSRNATIKSAATTITISEGTNPTTCNLVIENSVDQTREEWKELPRDPKQLAEVFNGTVPRPDSVKATIQPPIYGIDRYSPHLIAVSHGGTTPVINGEANVQPGRACRWIADAPGRTFFFEEKNQLLSYSRADLNSSSPGDVFTAEAWAHPSDVLVSTARLIHYVSEQCAYVLALEPVGSNKFAVIAGLSHGSKNKHKNEIFIKSEETVDASQWSHIAMTYEQSYGISIKDTQYIDCGDSVMLDITKDLTIEVYFTVDELSTAHGIIGKGRLGDTGKSVPYQVFVNTNGFIEFVFENDKGKKYTMKSTKAITPGVFHRLAITRKAGSREKRSNEQMQFDFVNHSGTTETMSVDSVSAVEFEQFYDINFYLDGTPCGSNRYEDKPPRGHDGKLDIGRCFITPSSALHTRGTLSEVRIWNCARTKDQVFANVRGDEEGLTAWWPMQTKEGNVTTDVKGNCHGKLQGPQWVRSPDPEASTFRLFKNGLPMVAHTLVEEHSLQKEGWGADGFNLAGYISPRSNTKTHSFVGMLEEVRVWRKVRTDEEMTDTLFSRLKGDKQDLVAYYTFDADSLQEDSSILTDMGLRGNHFRLPSNSDHKPQSMLSTAPISNDTAVIRSALSGVSTSFHETAHGSLSSSEYADMQRDHFGNLGGVLKRCYCYVKDGSWTLVSGYKVGTLVSEWIGQASFNPQIMGYVEGAPPVPSENMTAGVVASADNAAVVTITESDSVTYSLGVSKEGSCDLGFSASAGIAMGSNDLLIVAPMGFGIGKELTDINIEANLNSNFDISNGWSQNESQGRSINRAQKIVAATGGGFESDKPSQQLNPAVGRRTLIGNIGFALVQSSTADIFALRVAHNNALVSFRMVPNPDTPKDWNLVPFPINPCYTKQGTLDGKVGYDENGSVVMDPDYPSSAYGEFSYHKPREAYALEQRIRRNEQQSLSFYQDYETGHASTIQNVSGAAAGAAAQMLIPGVGPGLAANSAVSALGTVDSLSEESKRSQQYSKRDIVNTYIWTTDGGFFAESTETSDVRTEENSGTFSFSGATGGGIKTDLEIFSVGVNMEFEASMGGGMSLTKTKSKEAEKSFSMDVDLDVPGDLSKYVRTETGRYVQEYDEDGNQITIPGKVDAYRFKTFYLDASSENFEDFFGKVVDPAWLSDSDHPNAIALRQARQSDKKPPCWRVFHRVTFVSRIFPEISSSTEAPLESALQAAHVSSNWQLIQKLDPFVKDKAHDDVLFADTVRKTIAKYMPELVPNTPEIIQYLRSYYGMMDL